MYLPYFRYEQLKETVSLFLDEYVDNTNDLAIPINVFNIAKFLNIVLVPYSILTEYERIRFLEIGNFILEDGFVVFGTVLNESQNFVYYNDSKSEGRIRFTLLHEIAHIILGHKQQSDLAESEANFFAKYLIAPPVLVNRINPEDYVDIMNKFNLSSECARNSFSYYQSWKTSLKRRYYEFESYDAKILKIYEGVLKVETA